jgi:hypothetical protein
VSEHVANSCDGVNVGCLVLREVGSSPICVFILCQFSLSMSPTFFDAHISQHPLECGSTHQTEHYNLPNF